MWQFTGVTVLVQEPKLQQQLLQITFKLLYTNRGGWLLCTDNSEPLVGYGEIIWSLTNPNFNQQLFTFSHKLGALNWPNLVDDSLIRSKKVISVQTVTCL
jgi:hypothetical protein